MKRCSRSIFSSPYYFSSDGSGRFDLDEPEGTCYLASDDVAALRETLGPDYQRDAIVAESYFRERALWEFTPNPSGWGERLANLLDDCWSRVGLTNELFDIEDYHLPRSWAACFRKAGWCGLKVRLRHVLSLNHVGVALFGPTGPQRVDARFSSTAHRAIGPAQIGEFVTATGIKVMASPVPGGQLYVIS